MKKTTTIVANSNKKARKANAEQLKSKYEFIIGKMFTQTNLHTNETFCYEICGAVYKAHLNLVAFGGKMPDGSYTSGIVMSDSDLDELIAKGEIKQYFEGCPDGSRWIIRTLK